MRIGIIGAGQLGQMLGLAARDLDIECCCQPWCTGSLLLCTSLCLILLETRITNFTGTNIVSFLLKIIRIRS